MAKRPVTPKEKFDARFAANSKRLTARKIKINAIIKKHEKADTDLTPAQLKEFRAIHHQQLHREKFKNPARKTKTKSSGKHSNRKTKS